MTTLEALEARRDDLWLSLCRNGGDSEEWGELERLTANLQAALLDDHLWPPVAIDHAALEEWYQGQEDIPY